MDVELPLSASRPPRLPTIYAMKVGNSAADGSPHAGGGARAGRRRAGRARAARRSPSTATTRRTSRCGSRAAQRRPPLEIAAELAEAAAALPGVERAETAAAGVPQPLARARLVRRRAGRDRCRRRRLRRAAPPRRPSGCRWRWSAPTRQAPSRSLPLGTAPTATRVARLLDFAGHQVEREYYYNDAGTQMERFRASVEAARRGEPPPEDGYAGRLHRRLAALDDDPVPRMLREIEESLERFRIHFDSWARQSEIEERLPELLERLETYERDGAVWVRSTAVGDEKDRVLIRSPSVEDCRPTRPPTSPTSATSWSEASTARSTSSAPTTTVFAGGTRSSPACSATTPAASR